MGATRTAPRVKGLAMRCGTEQGSCTRRHATDGLVPASFLQQSVCSGRGSASSRSTRHLSPPTPSRRPRRRICRWSATEEQSSTGRSTRLPPSHPAPTPGRRRIHPRRRVPGAPSLPAARASPPFASLFRLPRRSNALLRWSPPRARRWPPPHPRLPLPTRRGPLRLHPRPLDDLQARPRDRRSSLARNREPLCSRRRRCSG